MNSTLVPAPRCQEESQDLIILAVVLGVLALLILKLICMIRSSGIQELKPVILVEEPEDLPPSYSVALNTTYKIEL